MKLEELKVYEYTSPLPQFAKKEDSLDKILGLMKENSIRHLPVIEKQKVVGIISHRDFGFKALSDDFSSLTAEDIMTLDPYTVSMDAPLEEVVFTMSKNKIGSAIVLDEEGDLLGIFTSTDALNALVEILRGDVEES